MTENISPSRLSSQALPGVERRHRKEQIFRRLGLGAILTSLLFLMFFLALIVARGHGAFLETVILVDYHFDHETLDIDQAVSQNDLANANYRSVIRAAMRELAPEVSGRSARRDLYGILGAGTEYDLRDLIIAQPSLLGTTAGIWTPSSDEFHLFHRNGGDRASRQSTRLSPLQIELYAELDNAGRIKTRFNWTFLSSGDSRDPEQAGVWGAVKGSILTLGICFLLSFGVGTLAAIYLEEFASKNWVMRVLEVNINNLAAVPSITYGLLGLAVFLNFFGLPRSAALVGGLVLFLMTLPTIIISSRVALQAVPPSIREAALAVGASRVQTVFHHVAPLALPGMLTGSIIGMARALGETAPLLMIGMVAFIVDPPSGVLDPSSALPVQVYLWAESPERAFAEKTAGAIMVLLVFLITMNLAAILLRRKFEKRW